ncbi:hypothetical protein HDV05_004855 [Chytridiales sp. JEL 0842]|nr:hypothetical protein HDV05_004855 [Chytridiales sp. JEL 0842]
MMLQSTSTTNHPTSNTTNFRPKPSSFPLILILSTTITFLLSLTHAAVEPAGCSAMEDLLRQYGFGVSSVGSDSFCGCGFVVSGVKAGAQAPNVTCNANITGFESISIENPPNILSDYPTQLQRGNNEPPGFVDIKSM